LTNLLIASIDETGDLGSAVSGRSKGANAI
jgi:hypothetical protein